jgi:hypothetical protein
VFHVFQVDFKIGEEVDALQSYNAKLEDEDNFLMDTH